MDINHIADLARIELIEKEKESLKKDLSLILDFIKKLDEINVEGVDPLYQTTELTNSLRADEYRQDFKLNEDFYKNLIDQAPHKKDNFVKVKSILRKRFGRGSP